MLKVCSVVVAFLLAFASPISMAQEMKSQKGSAKSVTRNLNQEQRIIHILDRITLGPRPGDAERVMKIGWEKYLDEQLHPERISDQIVEQKLNDIESIHLSTAEMAKYYPQPQIIRQALKARGIELPGAKAANADDVTNLKDLKKGLRRKNGNESEEMTPANSNSQQKQPTDQGQDANAGDLAKRQEYLKILTEMGYRPPQLAIQELQQSKILRAVYSEKQLQEVMTDFWFNHFNVFIQKGPDRILTTSYERDAIRPHVFDKFEDLLKATAQSPAMLWYLDNWMSASPPAQAAGMFRNREELGQMRQNNGNFDRMNETRGFGKNRRQIIEDRMQNQRLGQKSEQTGQPSNQQMDRMKPDQSSSMSAQLPGKIAKRSRGLNENYAREIMELHTLGVDGGYTQKDVQEVARCFTGWTLRNPRGGAEFVFNPMIHDNGEKIVLGRKIPAGGGKKDGEMVIHLLATHPSTAKFISTKLARKFVADNPSPVLIERMAQTFSKTDGDIRQVLRTIFTSPEFWALENYNVKIKTPFEMTVSAVRAIGAETNGGLQFHRWIAQMGEGLFMAQPPTGYADTSEQWVNTGALLERMNFALALASNQIRGTRVNLEKLVPGVDQTQPAKVVDHYLRLLVRGQISPQTRATIDESLRENQLAAGNGSRQVDTAKIVGLILGSPEFQKQ